MKETVKIDPVVLKQQVEDGMKKDVLAKHYGISVLQMGKALKAQGLKIRKFHAPAFEFVTSEEAVTETVEEVITDSKTEEVEETVETTETEESTTMDASSEELIEPVEEKVTWE